MRKMRKLNLNESSNVCKRTMPKEMSDWFDERIQSGQCSKVKDGSKTGYAVKSRDCTVVIFPDWNCDVQFKDVVNKLRTDSNKTTNRQTYN